MKTHPFEIRKPDSSQSENVQVKKLFPIIGICILIIIAGSLWMRPAQAQARQDRLPGVVILNGTDSYPGAPLHYIVEITSSGPNSPQIQSGTDLAVALERLKGLGYKVSQIGYLVFYCERD